MKRLIYILLFMAVVPAAKIAAQDMRTLFINMPDSVLPLLTATNRADCVDFLDAGMRARVTNRLDGHSELLQLKTDYLRMKMSNYTSLQMKLLPRSAGDTIVCMVSTVCAEACDSRIRFFTKQWVELPAAKMFRRPAVGDFFVADSSFAAKMRIADMSLIELELSPDAATMRAEYTMPAYMSREDSVFVSKGMRSIEYGWNGKGFYKVVK